MQILITDSSLVRTRVLHLRRWQVALGALLLGGLLMAISGLAYHFVFITAAREGWPLASQLVKLMVRDELQQQERVMRENLDAIAQKVGEMQAKLLKLEALGERVTGMAGVKTDELKALPTRAKGGQGGPFVPLARPTAAQLNDAIDRLDERADIGGDLFTLVESRLFEARLQALLVPSSQPVEGPVGSGFGFRIDPITGRAALHTGLDFPADVGTPIQAAAGGMVVVSETHPAYGHMIEIDHGNQLITRYAHASKLLVKVGTMVKRGQKIAEVGTSGRSTGPHLHFEVMLSGVQQNPARFLAGKVASPALVADASASPPKARTQRRRAAAAEPPTAWATPSPGSDLGAVGGVAQAAPAAASLSVRSAPAEVAPAPARSAPVEAAEPAP
ncbi:MAG TPA: M23 family metallopeptidase [Burkholderiaceae bacterium]|nr:M23 family metallopeptidase [Burkholderiaceae bacterium]